ncbi:MAG: helix-turn-helix domain-containing protein [Shimia sp.]|jgi:excisionase family DNA binding protein|nr:helix-turn-helix domain-containing protein [Shimia sp.]
MMRSSQLAEQLGLSKHKVLDLANRGLIPSLRLPSGHYRFDYEEVVGSLREAAPRSEEVKDDG